MKLKVIQPLFLALAAAFFLTGCFESADSPEAGQVSFNSESYQTVYKAVVQVHDGDIADSTLMVQVISTTDPVGITMPLYLFGGDHRGIVKFSITASVDGSTILVRHGDSIFALYNDVNPAATLIAGTVWYGTAGLAAFDSAAFHGAGTVLAPRSIGLSVSDPDLEAPTQAVTVSTATDQEAVTLTRGATGKYTGTVPITQGLNAPGVLQVTDSAAITVTYADITPVGTITGSASYFGPPPNPTHTGFSSEGSQTAQEVFGSNIELFAWENEYGLGATCTISPTQDAFEGGDAVKVTIFNTAGQGWSGWGWSFVDSANAPQPIDISAYATSTLHVAVKGSAPGFDILMIDNLGGKATVHAKDYGYTGDSTWHELNIPMSIFIGTSFSNLTYLLAGVVDISTSYTDYSWIIFDDLYWTKP